MYSAWTDHIKDPEAKQRFKNKIQASKPVLEHVKHIISQFDDGVGMDEMNKKYYESPSWAYRQAHNNGFRHALKQISMFIDLDKQVVKEEKKDDDRPLYVRE